MKDNKIDFEQFSALMKAVSLKKWVLKDI
jgi:hypothetical protein